jgi:hypothetical protein
VITAEEESQNWHYPVRALDFTIWDSRLFSAERIGNEDCSPVGINR